MQDVIRLSAKTVRRRLHREGYYSRVAVHKPLITKMNAHLRVQWCKNQPGTGLQRCGKKWYGQMSRPSPYSPQVGECMCGTEKTAWMLDPCSEGIWWLCCAVGGILLAWLGSTCPLRGKGDETFLSWWEWSLPGLNPIEHLWDIVLDSALRHHHHLNTQWGNISWMNGVHPSSRHPETWRINAKAHWSCSGGTGGPRPC